MSEWMLFQSIDECLFKYCFCPMCRTRELSREKIQASLKEKKRSLGSLNGLCGTKIRSGPFHIRFPSMQQTTRIKEKTGIAKHQTNDTIYSINSIKALPYVVVPYAQEERLCFLSCFHLNSRQTPECRHGRGSCGEVSSRRLRPIPRDPAP